MEDELGSPLLERKPWGVALTLEGTAVLQRARAVLREIERVEEDVRHLKGQRSGKLTIGVNSITGTAGLVEAFAEFRKTWPGVSVEFLELGVSQLCEQLRNRTLNFAFAALPLAPTDDLGQVQTVFSFETVFVTREAGTFAQATSLEELGEAEWIHTDVTNRFPDFLRNTYSRKGLSAPQRITRCTSFALFYRLVQDKSAVFTLTRHSMKEAEMGCTYVELALAERPPPLTLYLISPPESELTRPAEHFVNAVLNATESKQTLNSVF
ncbi:LysR family transcriptional regulator of abg operon [Paraburkholderia sp. GAS448]|uniref:LysR family transcriptional regulator n=1 Tax=Paraburkholderia sp. GAS448 TaxID=3035136 RepID=UPI003D1EB124